MQEFMLYSSLETKDTYLELWGGSTKHPDLMYRFSDYDDFIKNDEAFHQQILPGYIYQWTLWVASKLTFPWSSLRMVEHFSEIYKAYHWS